MARKLYVFGIGGTGSRVIKSLTMLFASGVKLKNNFDTVIPIIIDPDNSNGDLNRTKDILRLYQEIRNQVHQPDDFFAQELKTINELSNNSSAINPEYFQFKLNGVDQNTFNEYLGFDTLNDDYVSYQDVKSLVRMLYSENNLKAALNVGFKGNPNMGSIVLNQFTNLRDFEKFGQTFGDEDAIFIINSIFGGTGAAGFPLLLKNLRGNEDIPHHAKIKDAPIGGITYLPYFSLNQKDEINAESFEEKAKIAIDYYNRTIISKNKINSLYFVGNKGNTKHLEYAVGGDIQKNDAHFLELVGALAIKDFVEGVNSLSSSTQIKEFGIEAETENISFDSLNIENAKQFSNQLIKFRLYTNYLRKGLPKSLNTVRWTKSNIKLVKQSKNSILDNNYFSSSEYKNQIEKFNNYFDEWINEMENNKPSFNPFREITNDNALEFVIGRSPKRNKSFRTLDTENCKLIDDLKLRGKQDKKHTLLVKMFGISTGKILEKQKIINR